MSRGKKTKTSYGFLDEAGDTTFYGKGNIPIIGSNGVSCAFILGMVKFRGSLDDIRQKVIELQQQVQVDLYYKSVPSLQKKAAQGGYYFHATDDIAEVREKFFKFIKSLDCSFEVVVGRKIPSRIISAGQCSGSLNVEIPGIMNFLERKSRRLLIYTTGRNIWTGIATIAQKIL